MRNLLIFSCLIATTLCCVHCNRWMTFSCGKQNIDIRRESPAYLTRQSNLSVGIKTLVQLFLDKYVETLKVKIQSTEGILPDQQRIIFCGNQLDSFKVSHYYNDADSVTPKVLRVRGGFRVPVLRTRSQTQSNIEGNHLNIMNERDHVNQLPHTNTLLTRTSLKATTTTAAGTSAAVAEDRLSYVAKLTAIANLCRSEPLDVPWEDFQGTDFVLPDDRITRVCVTSKASVEEAPASVVGYCLPRGMSWFTFKDYKQMDSGAQSALVIKNTEIDTDIRNKTLNNLRNQRSQVWMGHSGIGKTIEVNYIMMELLRNLGEEGWPKHVAHRIGREIYLYELVDGRVRCSAVKGGGRTLQHVNDFCRNNYRKRNDLVFVLELGETEVDPQLSLTSFIAMPSYNVYDRLKTFRKSKEVMMAVRSPHSVEEALLVTEIMYTVDKETTLLNAGVSATASLEEFQAVLAERMEVIGPVLREILNKFRYADSQRHLIASSGPKNFLLGGLRGLNIEHIPPEAEYYVAPYTLPDSAKRGEFRLLCTNAALAVRKAITEDVEVADMRLHGFDYQLTEALLMQVLLCKPSPALIKRWERCVDPGFNTTLNRSHLLQNSPFRMSTAKRVVRFGTPILHKDASTMRDGDLYRSSLVNCPMCEFFLYENNNGKRRITFYQTATRPLPQHPIPVAALKQWFEALKLNEEHNSDVEVVIEAVVDWSESTTKGMKFLGEQQEPMDIAGLRALLPGRTISTTIVRAPFYPNAKTTQKLELESP